MIIRTWIELRQVGFIYVLGLLLIFDKGEEGGGAV